MNNPENKSTGIFPHSIQIWLTPVRLITRFLHSHFHHRYAGRYKHPEYLFALDLFLVSLIILLVGIMAWVVLFPPSLSSKIGLTAEVRPREIISGDRLTFTIFYENRSKEIVSDATLAVRLPPHFEITQNFPKEFNLDSPIIRLGTLAPGAHGEAKISGYLWAEVGKPLPLFLSLSFVREKGRRDLKTTRAEFKVKSSVLTLRADLPDRLIEGQKFPFTLTYNNTSQHSVPQVVIKHDWPEKSGVLKTEGAYASPRWTVDQLGAYQEGKIRAEGRIETTGERVALVFVPIVIVNDDELPQGRAENILTVIPQPLGVDIRVDLAEGAPVHPGQIIPVRAAYTNSDRKSLEDVTLTLEATSLFVDQNKLAAISLGRLEGGASGTRTFEVPLLPNLPASVSHDESIKNLVLSIRVVARGFMLEETPVALESISRELQYKIATPFALIAGGRYWTDQNEQIGRGPLPPLTDETTKYWIFWELSPTTSDLTNLEIRATLPPNTSWTGKSNVTIGSSIQYEPEIRTVRWGIDELPATWSTRAVVSGRFEVALTPRESEAGTSPLLLLETLATARDQFTEATLESRTDPISTTVGLDRRAALRGIVER